MAQEKEPLKPKTDNASLNDEIKQSTNVQGEVRPEDYPDRDTMKPRTGR